MERRHIDLILLLDVVILWVRLLSDSVCGRGLVYVTGSATVVATHYTSDESQRTLIVGKIAKGFGRITGPILVTLVLSGLYYCVPHPYMTGHITVLPSNSPANQTSQGYGDLTNFSITFPDVMLLR